MLKFSSLLVAAVLGTALVGTVVGQINSNGSSPPSSTGKESQGFGKGPSTFGGNNNSSSLNSTQSSPTEPRKEEPASVPESEHPTQPEVEATSSTTTSTTTPASSNNSSSSELPSAESHTGHDHNASSNADHTSVASSPSVYTALIMIAASPLVVC